MYCAVYWVQKRRQLKYAVREGRFDWTQPDVAGESGGVAVRVRGWSLVRAGCIDNSARIAHRRADNQSSF